MNLVNNVKRHKAMPVLDKLLTTLAFAIAFTLLYVAMKPLLMYLPEGLVMLFLVMMAGPSFLIALFFHGMMLDISNHFDNKIGANK